MEKAIIKNRIKYWLKTAAHDYKTMNGLFGIKRYSDCLFYGHIVLEKVLKAHVVQATGKNAPPIHNLTRLLELAKMDLGQETKEFLAIVNRFNIRSRYPDDKFNFYKQCDRKYTEGNLKKIIKIYKGLCQKLK